MTAQYQQYLRQAQLIFDDNKTAAIITSDMHFTFETTQWTFESGNVCQVRLYNPSDALLASIENEFTFCTVNAGYVDNPPTIFRGTILQTRRGWEGDRAEPYVDVTAQDGDINRNYQIIKMAMGNGSTFHKRMQAFATMMGVTIDRLPDTSQLPADAQGASPRGKTVLTNASYAVRDQALLAMSTWSIRGGVLHVEPYGGYPTAQALVLNYQTGLLGWPERTEDGINVKCLLNPNLSCDGWIQLNNADILTPQIATDFQSYVSKNVPDLAIPVLAMDGLYRIYGLAHSGDTRGNDWYTNLMCLAKEQKHLPDTAINTLGPF